MPDHGRLLFEYLAETDYFELVQKKTFALAIEFSHSGETMALFARDRKIRLFDFKTGKLTKIY